jgi:hypothetical protein
VSGGGNVVIRLVAAAGSIVGAFWGAKVRAKAIRKANQ